MTMKKCPFHHVIDRAAPAQRPVDVRTDAGVRGPDVTLDLTVRIDCQLHTLAVKTPCGRFVKTYDTAPQALCSLLSIHHIPKGHEKGRFTDSVGINKTAFKNLCSLFWGISRSAGADRASKKYPEQAARPLRFSLSSGAQFHTKRLKCGFLFRVRKGELLTPALVAAPIQIEPRAGAARGRALPAILHGAPPIDSPRGSPTPQG